MLSKRKLMKWRKEALIAKEAEALGLEEQRTIVNRLLEITQELIDQHLLKERKS